MKNVLLRSCLIDIQLRWQMGCDLFISIYRTKSRGAICGIIALALINWYELLNNESEGPGLLCHTIAVVHLDKTTPSWWPKSKPSTRACSLASCLARRTEVVKCRLLCVLISQLCWVNSQPALGKRLWLHKDNWPLFKIYVVACVSLRDATKKDEVCVCQRERLQEKENAFVKNKEGTIGTKRQKACIRWCLRDQSPP